MDRSDGVSDWFLNHAICHFGSLNGHSISFADDLLRPSGDVSRAETINTNSHVCNGVHSSHEYCIETEALGHSLVPLLAPFTYSLAPHRLLCSCAPLRSMVC